MYGELLNYLITNFNVEMYIYFENTDCKKNEKGRYKVSADSDDMQIQYVSELIEPPLIRT